MQAQALGARHAGAVATTIPLKEHTMQIRTVLKATATVAVTILIAFTVFILMSHSQLSQQPTQNRVVKSFELIGADGSIVTPSLFLGKWSLVFFGFTRCPDVCPTTLIDIGHILELLGSKAEILQPVFISLDPEWDTRQRMTNYMKNFDPRIIGLTGSMEQIRTVAENYGVFFRKQSLNDDEYTIDHSAALYLLNQDGVYIRPYTWQDGPEVLSVKLSEVMNER